VLGEGENAEVMESKSPHAEFDAFEKKLISRIALPFGFTYELLTGDYSAINDRTARVMLKQFEKHIRAEQAKLGMVLARVFRWSLSRAVKAGVLSGGPDGAWFNHSWGFPGFPYINPLQEAHANEINLRNRLTSRIKILAGQGDDVFDDVVMEQKYEDDAIAGADLKPFDNGVRRGETSETAQP
jgi:capsid protein